MKRSKDKASAQPTSQNRVVIKIRRLDKKETTDGCPSGGA